MQDSHLCYSWQIFVEHVLRQVLPYAINDLPGPYSWRIYFYVGEVNIKQENKL